MIFGFISAILVLLADLLTKHFIYGTAAHSVIGDFLWVESRFNEGIAFSFFEGKGYIFAVIGILACVVFIWLIISKKYFVTKLAKVGVGMVLGGTLGNVVDRLCFGGVRDFIYLKFINYPIFNIADLFIVVGVILLCVFIIVSGTKKDKKVTVVSEQKTSQGSDKKDG